MCCPYKKAWILESMQQGARSKEQGAGSKGQGARSKAGSELSGLIFMNGERRKEEGRKGGRDEGRKGGREEGRKEGREEGRKGGKEEGRLELVLTRSTLGEVGGFHSNNNILLLAATRMSITAVVTFHSAEVDTAAAWCGAAKLPLQAA